MMKYRAASHASLNIHVTVVVVILEVGTVHVSFEYLSLIIRHADCPFSSWIADPRCPLRQISTVPFPETLYVTFVLRFGVAFGKMDVDAHGLAPDRSRWCNKWWRRCCTDCGTSFCSTSSICARYACTLYLMSLNAECCPILTVLSGDALENSSAHWAFIYSDKVGGWRSVQSASIKKGVAMLVCVSNAKMVVVVWFIL